jgi:hypothetical protein
MKRIEVQLNLAVVAPMLDVIKAMADDLRENRELLPEPAASAADADLRDPWMRELYASRKKDLEVLMGLFDERFFSEGVVRFEPGNAEEIARACSAVRLRIRERHLAAIEDDRLESSEDIDIAKLDAGIRRAFLCYIFLATIQELIIHHLDETIIGG